MYFRKLEKDELFKLAEFVVRENFIHHCTAGWSTEEVNTAIHTLYQEDLAIFDDSYFYVAMKGDKIIGSVKVTRWDGMSPLPVERLFNIDMTRFEMQQVWHVGRFAISWEEKAGARLLRKLITLAIYPICMEEDALMVAECDSKFVRGMEMMGIKTAALGMGKYYLGSLTLPIYAEREWLKEYLDKSPYLKEMSEVFQEEGVLKV